MATIKNIHDYGDIINLPYKKSKKYKHMSQSDGVCACKSGRQLGR